MTTAKPKQATHPECVYRLHRPDQNAFDTIGCRYAEGRWHSRFTEVVYAAENRSLAVLETLAHAGGRSLPPRTLTQIVLSATALIESAIWLSFPKSQSFGDIWVKEQRTPVLAVPSAVVHRLERNYILNPRHPAFESIRAGLSLPFTWDARFITA